MSSRSKRKKPTQRTAKREPAAGQKLPPGLTQKPGPAVSRTASQYLTQGTPATGSTGTGSTGTGSTGVGPIRVRQEAPASSAPATKASTKSAAKPVPDDSAEDVPAWAAKVLEEVLTCTYWLDPGEEGEPFSATIKFSGQRTAANGKGTETFWQEQTVHQIVPGTGPVAVTAEVHGITPGEWKVTAKPVKPGPYRPLAGVDSAPRTPWPRRVRIRDVAQAGVQTAKRPFTKVPGIFRFAYAGLIALGVLVGLALEVLLLKHDHYGALGPLLYSVGAIAAGLVGAKVWYVAEQRGQKMDGWCIQGFVTGTAVVIVGVALAGAGVPAGAFLGANATALLLGMAIGRPGCFWAGCCVGRPTTARWGIWSSDRTVGCRRFPAQPLEALASLVAGLGVLSYALVAGVAKSGPAAVAGIAAFTLLRQFILGLRAQPPSPSRWRYGRQATIAVAAIALVASIVWLALR